MNRSDNLVQRREIILYTYLSLISLITLIGIGGNILVIFVVSKSSKMQSTTNIQIVSLAVADLLHLSAIPQLLLQITGHSFIPSNVACIAYCFITHVNSFAGTLTLTTMGFDRFLAIIYPFRSQKLRSPRNTMIGICVTWVLAIVLMTPTFINAKLNSRNSTRIFCIQRWPNKNAQSALLPTISYTFFFGYVLPGVLILSFYLAIVVRLRNLRRRKQDTCNSITSSSKTTILVLMIVIAFLLCNLPYWVNQWKMIIYHNQVLQRRRFYINLLSKGLYNDTGVKDYISWTKEHKRSMTFQRVMISYFCQMTSYLNSALNPVLYSFLSVQFRTSFAAVISCKCTKTRTLNLFNRLNNKFDSSKPKSMCTADLNSKRNPNTQSNSKMHEPIHILETNV